MAGGKSAYYQAKMLDHTLGDTPYTPPSSLWAALSTSPFTSSATGSACDEVDPTGTSYVRIEVANNTTNFPDATGADPAGKSIAVDVTFPTAGADYGTVYSAYLCDAATGGNIVYGADAVAPLPIAAGSTMVIQANTWNFTEQ